jgi:hypothetical protein
MMNFAFYIFTMTHTEQSSTPESEVSVVFSEDVWFNVVRVIDFPD